MILKNKDKLFLKEINIKTQKLKDLKIQIDLLQLHLKFRIRSKIKHKLITNKILHHHQLNIA
jgi:hypothetical protein